MNKLIMAHEYVMNYMASPDCKDTTVSNIVSVAWSYADLMQDEADKRNNKETCDKNIGLDSSVLKPSNSMELECQPDWSQAPEWANWWAMDGFSKQGNWYDSMPYIDEDSEIEDEWKTEETYLKAPSFDYTGNWQDSLRKRPQ